MGDSILRDLFRTACEGQSRLTMRLATSGDSTITITIRSR
jgi:hypothetical protein